MKESPQQFNRKSEYIIPEDILRNELEVYDRLPDREFWTEKNLEYWFAKDSAFGAKLALGFREILGKKLEEDTPEHEEFGKYADIMEMQSSTTPERARAALWLRKWVAKMFDIPFEKLTARDIVTLAYMSEAEAMRPEFDPDREYPFTLGSGLKISKEKRNAKEVLQKELERQQKGMRQS